MLIMHEKKDLSLSADPKNDKSSWLKPSTFLIIILVISFSLSGGYGISLQADNQILHSQLEAVSAERDDFKSKLEACEIELAEAKEKSNLASAEYLEQHSMGELANIIVDLSLDDAVNIASLPETPESVLYILSQRANSISPSDNELIRLLVALLSAPNCNASIITQLIPIAPPEFLSTLAQSTANDEFSLYLLASRISNVFTSSYDAERFHDYLVTATIECIRNPAVTKDTLQILEEFDDSKIKTCVKTKLESLS